VAIIDTILIYNAKPGQLLIQVDFVKSSFECPECGKQSCTDDSKLQKKDLLIDPDCRTPRRVSPRFEQ